MSVCAIGKLVGSTDIRTIGEDLTTKVVRASNSIWQDYTAAYVGALPVSLQLTSKYRESTSAASTSTYSPKAAGRIERLVDSGDASTASVRQAVIVGQLGDLKMKLQHSNRLRDHLEDLRQAFRPVVIAMPNSSSSAQMPTGLGRATSPNAEWNEERNQRRCDLIDKEIDGRITELERAELHRLQEEMLAQRRQVAPLPLHELRQLHQVILQRANSRSS